MYQKEIIYLGLYKDGDRLGSAGFLKVEKRDKEGNLSLVIKNVPHSINGKYPVRYYNGADWKEEDGITVREGGGKWEKQEPDSLRQIRLQIMLPGGYLVEGVSKEAVRQEGFGGRERDLREQPTSEERAASRSERQAAAGVSAARPEPYGTAVTGMSRQEAYGEAEPGAARPEPHGAAEQGVSRQEAYGEAEPEAARLEPHGAAEQGMTRPEPPATAETTASLAESVVQQEQQRIERIVVQKQGGRGKSSATEGPQKPLMADALVIEGLKEDKWEQILDTYDNIHPYGDGRVYVKLNPKDFIILSGKYQHLVNNSFLLHGFYNYRHVILGKEGETYYLGVPGVFYEREKMVALMFGFEAFECERGESKPGEFGYYLRKVEI